MSHLSGKLGAQPQVVGRQEPHVQERELKDWLTGLRWLTPAQRQQLRQRLDGADSLDEVSAAVQRRHDAHPQCPHCASPAVQRYGHANGLQRYRCRGCSRSFNALTGTPLARLRHRDKWLGQAEVLDQGLSVRRAAAHLQVHRTTAFRWRHRFLQLPSQLRPAALQGVAEADETYELRSFKGQRKRLAQAQRPARRRGGHAAKRGLSDEHIPVLVLRDRSGATTDFVLPHNSKACVAAVLPLALAPDAVLCTDGSSMLAAAARQVGLEHQALNISKGERRRGAWHIQNVNAYHSRFKGWMRRFNGIASSYLENYLGWFRALDRYTQSGAKSASFLNIALGV